MVFRVEMVKKVRINGGIRIGFVKK